jgi:hypothetical protein
MSERAGKRAKRRSRTKPRVAGFLVVKEGIPTIGNNCRKLLLSFIGNAELLMLRFIGGANLYSACCLAMIERTVGKRLTDDRDARIWSETLERLQSVSKTPQLSKGIACFGGRQVHAAWLYMRAVNGLWIGRCARPKYEDRHLCSWFGCKKNSVDRPCVLKDYKKGLWPWRNCVHWQLVVPLSVIRTFLETK